MGLFDWFKRKAKPQPKAKWQPKPNAKPEPKGETPAGPEIVEVPSIQAEYVYVQRLTCQRCGRPEETERKGSGTGSDGRMHDFWTVSCRPCGTSRRLILSVPQSSSLDFITKLAAGQEKPEAKALLDILAMARAAQKPAAPAPPPPPTPLAQRTFIDDFVERTEAVLKVELTALQDATADVATKESSRVTAVEKRKTRLSLALELLEKVADSSVSDDEKTRLQQEFITTHMAALYMDCLMLGIPWK